MLNSPTIDRRLSVAPMMDCTDRYDRFLLRVVSRRVLLYTEMVVADAVVRRDPERLIGFDPAEHPVALQLGGSDPATLADAAAIGAAQGYDEINLNVGCPSDRVSAGRFGACLMQEPELVARCVRAMADACPGVPVTVKSRIGVDDRDSHEDLRDFVARVSGDGGCTQFAIHARKAWLSGLSPKENREIPPLHYDRVWRIKTEFPHLAIAINGGIRSLAEARDQLGRVDGVMIGRAAYHTPHILAAADREIFGEDRPAPSREEIVGAYRPYLARMLADGVPLHRMTRHLLGLYHGERGGRIWRRVLTEGAARRGAGLEVVDAALEAVRAARARAPDRGDTAARPPTLAQA